VDTPPPAGQTTKAAPPVDTRTVPGQQAKPPAPVPVKTPEQAAQKPPATTPAGAGGDDEGELTVHIVKKGESMTTIAQQYGVTVEQILKWNLLKSISVKPGQELYIFVRK
jgi:LysM repeat protein